MLKRYIVMPTLQWFSLSPQISSVGATAALLLVTLFTPSAAQTVSDLDSSRRGCRSAQADAALVTRTIRQISVRILNQESAGSGVIIAQQGQTYTVITNAHVVAGLSNPFSILTSDGQTHSGRWLNERQFHSHDLALIQFTSNRSYAIAELSQDDSRLSETAYAAGFPNWRLLDSTRLEETIASGFQAFQLSIGRVEMLLPKPLEQGYQLGYTNDIDPGMSGGPVLNCNAQLIGLNGKLQHPLQGREAFHFADGTVPSEALFQQMESLSWAIPSATIRQVLEQSMPSH